MNNNYLKKKVSCEEEDFAVEYVAFYFILFMSIMFFIFYTK